jgi:hypothetical protein
MSSTYISAALRREVVERAGNCIDYAHDKAIVRLFNPRIDNWNTYFQLDTLTAHIEGLGAQGRVTVFLLRLNDPDRVMDRKLLLDANRYPCKRDE